MIVEFPLEAGQEDEYLVTKVGQLSMMVGDPRKQVEKLQMKKVPSTPPKVLEERSKAASEAVVRISKGEKLCTEEIEAIFAMWEALLEDETMEKINRDVGRNPPTKPRRQGFSLYRLPTNAISLSTLPDRFYPTQQHPRSGRSLTRDVQGRAFRTEFSAVGTKDMGI